VCNSNSWRRNCIEKADEAIVSQLQQQLQQEEALLFAAKSRTAGKGSAYVVLEKCQVRY
jgi:hypothetical protein